MSSLLFSAATKKRIETLVVKQPQSLLIVGQSGSGRSSVAQYLAATVLGVSFDKLFDYPYFSLVQPDGSSVKIEQIQNLKKMLNLKTPMADKKIRRIIIIEAAELMTRDAQNAALKFIEEPPADTMILLIAENERDLLETIRSRCAVFTVINPDQETASNYAVQTLGVSKEQALTQYRLSGGRTGLFLALLQNTEHPLVAAIARARQLLAASKFDKIVAVEELSKDKLLAKNVLFALDRIAQVGLTQSAEKSTESQIMRWMTVLQVLENTEKQIQSNVNNKLVFTNLMLAL